MAPTETYARRLSTPEQKKLVPRTYSPIRRAKSKAAKPKDASMKVEKKEKKLWQNLSQINTKLVLGEVAEEIPKDDQSKRLQKVRLDHANRFGKYYKQVLKPSYQCPTFAFQKKVKKTGDDEDEEPEEGEENKKAKVDLQWCSDSCIT